MDLVFVFNIFFLVSRLLYWVDFFSRLVMGFGVFFVVILSGNIYRDLIVLFMVDFFLGVLFLVCFLFKFVFIYL